MLCAADACTAISEWFWCRFIELECLYIPGGLGVVAMDGRGLEVGDLISQHPHLMATCRGRSPTRRCWRTDSASA